VSVTTQNLYEQTLVLRSQIGDASAFRELLTLYSPRLLRFVRKMLLSAPELVEDVTQEIWIRIHHSLPTLVDAGKFGPWAFRIARDRVYREFRRRKLPMGSLDEADREAAPVAEEPSIDTEEIQRGLDTLSPEHREVLMLRYFEEMDYESIARITGATLGTIRSRLHYAKCALRRAFQLL
jgi:RNA polymerase sigma-70 factor (ECF subfamily)